MKIRMIYLAAGNSRRFGSNKLYYPIEGRPMYQYGLQTLLKVLEAMPETSLTVVTEFSEIAEWIKERQKIFGDRITVVGSPDRELGISYSIREGLKAGEGDYYLFSVADQPGIRPETVLSLIQETIAGGYAGGYVQWQGHSGNPAIFSGALRQELLSLTGDTGGKKILRGRKDICRVQALEESEIQDIDVKQ
jgi:molybdenum cofactor cytidylyltransferase